MTDTQTHTTGGTEMPLTHCHTCGRELPWNRIYLGDRAYCGAECMPAKTADTSTGPQTCHACGEAIGQTLWMTTEGCYCSRECMPPGVTPEAQLEAAMKEIARIAHEGGLDGMGERSALNAIRKLSLPWWDGKEKTT